MKFTVQHYRSAQAEVNKAVAELVATHFDFSGVQEHFINAVKTTRMELFPIRESLSHLTVDFVKDIEVADDVFYKKIQHLEAGDKRNLYEYRDRVTRIIGLNTAINNKQKLSFVAKDLVEKIMKAALRAGTEEITLSEAVHVCNLKPTTAVDKRGNHDAKTDPWMIDEVRLQFINELAEMDILDVQLKDKVHMVALGDAITKPIDKTLTAYLVKLSQFLSKKTIWLEPAPMDEKHMVTRSSWYYQTPTLSGEQVEYFRAMHNIKYQFVEDAEARIADAYKEHLKVDEVSQWMLDKIAFFKEQIRASHANGGHYIAVRGDSIWRTYMMAEIGHFQTSPALRSLVKVADIVDKTKYDAKNNVVQVYALGLKSKSLGSFVQLVQENNWKEDIRETLAKIMNTGLKVDTFNKDNIKPLFMIWAYNAGKKRLLEGVVKEELNIFGSVHQNFGAPGLARISGVKDLDLVWDVWTKALSELVPEIVVLKKVFERIVKHNPLKEVSWVMPDGTIAQYASASTVSKSLHWVGRNGTKHQHTHYRKEIVTDAKAAGLLPRVIHSIDAYIARQLVLRASKVGITVVPNHDSFTFDKSHTTTIIEMIKLLYVEVMESNLLESIIEQLNVTNKSLAVKDQHGKFISFVPDLKVEDIMAGMPVEYEA